LEREKDSAFCKFDHRQMTEKQMYLQTEKQMYLQTDRQIDKERNEGKALCPYKLELNKIIKTCLNWSIKLSLSLSVFFILLSCSLPPLPSPPFSTPTFILLFPTSPLSPCITPLSFSVPFLFLHLSPYPCL